MEHLSNPFEYLAFDDTHLAVLAHGVTAGDALRRAEQIAPDAPIHVLHAGQPGWKIWYFRESLADACGEIRSLEDDGTSAWAKHMPRPDRAPRSDLRQLPALLAGDLSIPNSLNAAVVIPFPNARRKADLRIGSGLNYPSGA